MTIPNSAKQQNSYIVGTLSHESPSRVSTAIVDYVLDPVTLENYATPSRACTYNAGTDTVAPGGDGVFAGLILGNERVPSDGESWYQKGDKVELVEMGSIAVNIDLAINNVARGAAVHFQKDNGKLGAGAGNGTTTITIKNAVITEHGDKAKSPCLALVTLTGPVA
jgi:hypothetical protein